MQKWTKMVLSSVIMFTTLIMLCHASCSADGSGWVLPSEVPADAIITDTSYSYRESCEDTIANLAGWTQNGNYWKQTGSGSRFYASFPSTYDSNNQYYRDYAREPYSSYETDIAKRTVSNGQDGWIYWHWMYSTVYASGTTRRISSRQGYFDAYGNTSGSSAYGYNYFYAMASTINCPYLDTGYCCNQNVPSYNAKQVVDQFASSADRSSNTSGLGTDRFFRFERYRSDYTDYVKTYKYYRDIYYSSEDPGNSETISNKVMYVKYAYAGNWGSLSWQLENSGLLTITGNGSMNDFDWNSAEAWLAHKDEIKQIVILSGVTNVSRCAFRNCSSLSSITIPQSVTRIDSNAYSGCSSLIDAVIPASVKSIDYYAFDGCSAMRSLTLSEGLRTIGSGAFNKCSSLTEVTVPASVNKIGDFAFGWCESLSNIMVDVANSVYSDLDGILYNKNKTAIMIFPSGKQGSFAFPSGMTEIGNCAFYSCSGLTSVNIPSSVSTIGDSAFSFCRGLTEVTIPEGVTSLGDSAFYDCSSLKTVVIPTTVQYIDTGAFSHCASLTNAVIPQGVQLLNGNVFFQCGSLKSVTIPTSVTKIDINAFYGCSNLSDIYYNGTQSQWDAINFDEGNEALSTATLHFTGFTISYNANGGAGEPQNQTKLPGIALILSSTIPTRADAPAGNYTVTLNANGGDVGTSSLTASRTTKYIFNNWNTKQDGSGISYNAGGDYTADAAVTLYAQWNSSTSTAAVTLPTPSRVGYTFQGWATSSNANSGVKGSYTPTGNMTLYAIWMADAIFDVAHDAYPFGNNMSAFNYMSVGPGASYPIKYDPSFTLIFGDSVAGKSKYKQAMMSRWGGNCCGMSSSTALMFANAGISAASFGKNDVSSLSIGDSNGSISVKTFVEAMQIAQYTDQFARDYKGNRVYTYELTAGSDKLTDLYNAVNAAIAQGKETIIGIGKSGVGAHALLAYKLENVSTSAKKMYIYDCNYPGAVRYFTLNIDSQGRISGWTYDMGSYGVWGTEGTDGSSCFISYIPYDTIEYIWTNRGNLYDNKEMLSFSGENLSIKDFSGTEVAAIVNGQLQTSRTDIYELPELSMNWATTKSIFLPKDFYTIESSDGADLELSMVDHNLGASITTSAAAVSFAVDDNTRENTVIVENASQNDTYSVSLESSFAGVKYENVAVRGTGRGESISISGDNDTLSISNCNVDSLQINGVERITYTITAYSGMGGSISPKGDTLVDVNGSKLFNITPDSGYVIDSVKIDGNDIGAVAEYEFQNVIRDHTITATFKRAYGVTEAFFDRSSNMVSIDLINQASAKLVCAVYNSEGQMLTVSSKNILKNCGTATISLACGSLPSDITIKLLVLDSRWRPLCSSYSFSN